MSNDTEARPVALITGGAKRVGRAIVEKLAECGYDIAFTYHHSKGPADELLASIRAKGVRAHAIQVDLTDPPGAVRVVEVSFGSVFRRLDVLVNSASVYQPGRLADVTYEKMREYNAIHMESPLLLAKAFAPLLRQSGGCIVNMVDLLAERPWPEYLAYCASKAGLWNLTLGLARELAPEVRVNGIAPGVVEWPPGYPEEDKQKYLKRVPLGRAGSPEDVAELVYFLAAKGTYITGQIVRLDGGRSIT